MYDRMVREHGYSIRKLADKLGKDKGYLENRLRLADAPPEIRELVSLRKDTLSHAYELMKVEDPKKRRRLADQVARGELTLVKLRDKIEGRRTRPAARRRRADVEVDGPVEAGPVEVASRRRAGRADEDWPPAPASRLSDDSLVNAKQPWPTPSRSWSTCSAARSVRIDPGHRPGEPRQVPDDREAQARERHRDRPERRPRLA